MPPSEASALPLEAVSFVGFPLLHVSIFKRFVRLFRVCSTFLPREQCWITHALERMS